MRMPPGLPSNNGELVCKLRRSLYGLKQAGREWALLFSQYLVGWGMEQSGIDSCLYTYHGKWGKKLLVLIYVDDALIVDNCSELRDRFVTDLSNRFPTEDKGALHWILNTRITRDRSARKLEISQELYVADLLQKYSELVDSSTTRVFDSPMEEGLIFHFDDEIIPGGDSYESFAPQRAIYMSLVGA